MSLPSLFSNLKTQLIELIKISANHFNLRKNVGVLYQESNMSQPSTNNTLMSSVSGALFGGGIAGVFMASYYFIDDVMFNNAHQYAVFYLITGACAIYASNSIKKVNK